MLLVVNRVCAVAYWYAHWVVFNTERRLAVPPRQLQSRDEVRRYPIAKNRLNVVLGDGLADDYLGHSSAIDTCIRKVLYSDPKGINETIRKLRVPGSETTSGPGIHGPRAPACGDRTEDRG